MSSGDLVERLWESDSASALTNEAAREIERLQRIIDSRPAINAGLPKTYIEWSQGIYAMEIARAMGEPQ